MPIQPPALDDRSFDDLVADLIRRIPSHTPEWTHVGQGDPGRTMIELFGWLADTILYRANLIPERQRLAFLRLLGAGMRPAVPARGLVQVTVADDAATAPVEFQLHAPIAKPVPFLSLTELTAHAVEGRAYIKRRPDAAEARQLSDLLPDLQALYGISSRASGYVTTAVFAQGMEAAGRDIVADTLDDCLWIALLAPAPDTVDAIRQELGGGDTNRRRVLNVGVAPALSLPDPFEEIGIRARIPFAWEINSGQGDGDGYLPLEVLSDTTNGLTRTGVQRLLLPGQDDIGAPTNDVLQDHRAGVGDRPPRLDDPVEAARLVTWIRMRPDPAARLDELKLAWAGTNAVEIEQRELLGRQTIGQGSGASDLTLSLGATSVDPASLLIEVEEEEGLRPWRLVPDTAAAGRDDRVFSLDPEEGTVRFGDGVRGMIPGVGRAVQVASMRAGGGVRGNLPPGTITAIGTPPGAPRMAVNQPLPTSGGIDAESLAEAEARIPGLIRNAERAVTVADYKEMALRTPGVRVGRIEVLERFKPHQRRNGVPGVVSVMVIPARDGTAAPLPRPDRPLLESVHAWLDQRRPATTELYTIGTDYRQIGVSAAVELADSDNREAVLNAVSETIRMYLWCLPPGGPDGQGWPLGRAVDDREIEAVVARIPGVRAVAPIRLFVPQVETGRYVPVREDRTGRGRIALERWQLPELAMLSVAQGASASTTLPATFGPATGDDVAVPIVPEVC